MPVKIGDLIKKGSVNEIKDCVRQGIPLAVFGVPEGFKYYFSTLFDDKVLYIVKDEFSLGLSYTAISGITDKKVTALYAKDETLLMNKAFSKENLFKRINSCYEIKAADIIVATPESLSQAFSAYYGIISLKNGNSYKREDLVANLVRYGYVRTETAESIGTFAYRGDVFEIFPINRDNPVRIDFFDDVIESIKETDAETGKRLRFLDEVCILQAVETIFSDADYSKIKEEVKKDFKKVGKDGYARLKILAGDVETAIENKDVSVLSPFLPLSENFADFTGVLDKNTIVIFDEAKRIKETADLSYSEFIERFSGMRENGESFSVAEKLLLSPEELTEKLKNYREVAVQTVSTAIPFFSPLKIISPNVSAVSNYTLDFKEFFSDVDTWLKNGYTVNVFTDGKERAEKINFELSVKKVASAVDPDISGGGVAVYSSKLLKGFIYHEDKTVLVGSGNLYSKQVAERKAKSKKKGYFSAPEKGDYCVHEVHGIGRVLGNRKVTTVDGTKDYIAVEYYGGDILYVPVEQMDILTKYLGGERPKLSKIGGKDFERVKDRVRKSIKAMSFDLKKLYNERNLSNGFEFFEDTEAQSLFEEAFPFEDTEDQITANAEVRADMLSDKVMDRLICGDVGFGKTEVAFRAVFRAVSNGKQAAMLAPTTILSEQHYNTAVERFKDFGVKVEVLNRFKSLKEQKRIIEDLKNGKIDFIIGTHRLLSKDVSFYDLGLLVLDEEQRFGVEHKEKIKLLKKNVDALTLTATPIPRTLHMSLSGIRAISTINTPPKKRLPVQTYVTEETDALITDSVKREINRGGQVFILYNRVETIFLFAERVKKLLPETKVTVVHGQMEEKALEKNIMSFYRGESDILISTTIIENGIDLPRANTLIVIDADKMGLSTLYQLKGRVGRSDRLAYAYFTFKREKILSDAAYSRLNAIVEFAEMGSGIKIAMRDLEIRGAGNVLGAEQHGHMEKIGYELYSKLLKEELTGEEETVPELDIRVTAFIPDDYIDNRSRKMDAYKEIAELNSEEDVKELRESFISEYGEIPEEVNNLIIISEIKRIAGKFGVEKITVAKDTASLAFENIKAMSKESLMETLLLFGKDAYMSVAKTPKIEFVKNNDRNERTLLKMLDFLKKAKDKEKSAKKRAKN